METTASSDASNALLALSEELAAAVERIGRSIVAVDAGRRRASSGIAWDEHHIVTADHVLEDDDVTLTLSPDATAKAVIVGRDPSTDIALLRTDTALQPARAADLAALKVGHLVLAVARDDDGDVAASFGVISSLDGPWRTWRGGDVERFVRPDLSLYPGFSGGALVDVGGLLVGMNTWGLSRRTALTLPVATLERVIAQLCAGGIKHGYLGVALQAVRLPRPIGERYGITGDGAVIVVDVAEGGPAERAGVVIGDVILALADARIADAEDLQHALYGDAVGTNRTLQILRAGAPHELSIVVGERPSDA
jgi:serine protease DegQ